MKKFLLLIAILSTFMFFSCPNDANWVANNHVVIVFTNDMYNQLLPANETIGYPRVKGLKDYLRQQTKSKVVLVDAGDFILGDGKDCVISQYSSGKEIIDIMNRTGYDYATIGEKDLTFGASLLEQYTKSADFKLLCSNLEKKEGMSSKLFSRIKTSCVYQKFGNTKVAFIGLTTPDANNSGDLENWHIVSPKSLKGKLGPDGRPESEPDPVICKVQEIVDNAMNNENVDYIVLVTHIGAGGSSATSFSSVEIAKAIGGINLVIDGHSTTIPEGVDDKDNSFIDKNNKKVYYGHCGRFGEKVGLFTIQVPGGGFPDVPTLEYYDKSKFEELDIDGDSSLESYIKSKKESITKKISTKLGSTSKPLTRFGEPSDIKPSDINNSAFNSYKNALCQESWTGDFLADAFRDIADAEIGLINAGGIGKTGIPVGDITGQSCYDLLQYMNSICTVNVTVNDLKEIMEHSVSNLRYSSNPEFNWNEQSYYIDTAGNVCPNVLDKDYNGFLHISGMLVKVNAQNERGSRITQIKVLRKSATRTDEYNEESYKLIYDSETSSSLDSLTTYKLAATNYLLIGHNDGYSIFDAINDKNPQYLKILNKTVSEADALAEYIKYIGNINEDSVPMYKKRITRYNQE